MDVGWDGVVYGQACKHNIVQMSYTAPTCIKDGYLARGCNKCGYMEFAGSLPKLGHDNSIIYIPATCTSSGSRETRCTRCGYISGRTTIAALGHSINANTTPPNCTSAGKTVVTCGRSGCGYKTTNNLPALGHNWVFQMTVPPKCVFDGYSLYRCTRCSLTKEGNPVPRLGHNYVLGDVKAATCEKDGYRTYNCTKCSSTKSETIPRTGHSTTTTTISATCTERGYTLKYCIKNCGYSLKSGYFGPLGHDWRYEDKSPTCTEEGYSLKHCSRCSEHTLTVFDKLSHNTTSSVSPTHQSNGHYWSRGCSRCSYESDSGYQILSNCLSCTTAPSVSFANMSGDTVLSEADTNFKPQIKVFDNENDTLTCKYHLDGSSTATGTMTVTGTKPEKTVTFTTGFNAANLAEGNHTIKATAKDPVAPMGETTITFKVDKSAPTISKLLVTPSTNNVKFTVTASDSISGLASTAYRYTVNGVSTGWLAANTYTKAGLVPNTGYSNMNGMIMVILRQLLMLP